MSQSNDPAELSAVELLRLYGARKLSPLEATEACLARIRARNAQLLAYNLVDEETTLREARRAQERWARGMTMGRLDGVPVAIKDLLLTRGWTTRKGSRLTESDAAAQVDAPAVAALRRHGAVPLGKTTTPELGWKGVTDSPAFGITRNPWDPERTAGGSSGGSAAAVAAGMGPLALGTDGGGSIRIPAGFCGVVGLKPTHGRVPMWPRSPFGVLAHVGPMSWTVRDAALLLNVLCERDARDPTMPRDGVDYLAGLEGGVAGLRVALSPALGIVEVDSEVSAAVKEAAGVLEQLGARIEETDPGIGIPLETFEGLWYGGAANALRDMSAEQRAMMDPGLVEIAERGAELTALDYLAADSARARLVEHMSRFHERYDLLLTPTLPMAAFEAGREVPASWPHERWHTWSPFSYPFNLTGQPAASVPCGFTGAGLPVGLQIVGPRHADALVLRAAHAYQSACPLTDRRPE